MWHNHDSGTETFNDENETLIKKSLNTLINKEHPIFYQVYMGNLPQTFTDNVCFTLIFPPKFAIVPELQLFLF